MKRFQVHVLWAFAVVALFGCPGCATRQTWQNDDSIPRRPTLVLVYDFHASPSTVFEDPRLIGDGLKDFTSASRQARQAAIGQQVRTRIHQQLIDGINALGLPAQFGDPSRPAPAGALMIRGEFLSASPDNLHLRNIVEFGKDKSTVDVSIYTIRAISPENLLPLLHFLTDAQTSAMPAVMWDDEPRAASAARRARAETRAEPVTIDTYRLQVDQLVDESVNQAIAHLSQYFANQGWISRAQVRATF